MPGFGRNTRVVVGQALQPNAIGSVRQPLTPFAERFQSDPTQAHKPDVNDFRNNGTPIKVSGTTDALATCIHVADLSALDEVYLWASNIGEAAAQITVSFVSGGYMVNGSAPADADIDYALNAPWRVVTTVSPKAGMELVYPGIPHTNNDAIFAVSSNSKIYLSGFVMRKHRVSKTDINQGYDGAD